MLKLAGKSDAERVAFAFRLCTARLPTEKEMPVLESALARLRQQYRSDPDASAKLIAIGESKPDAALNAAELAAHTVLASLLLNLDETLTIE
jgi:hypothetical protein